MNGSEGALWALLLITCFTDLMWGKIHNAITFPFLFLGLSFAYVDGGWEPLLSAAGAVALLFAIGFPLFRWGVFAAGDVKLLMALGAWKGWAFSLRLSGIAVLFGAGVGLVEMGRKRLKEGSAGKTLTKIPFAPAFLSAYLCIKIWERYQGQGF